MGRINTYVFEAIKILVPLVAILALVRLFLLHAHLAREWLRRLWVDNGERAVSILVQLLGLMAVLLVVSALSISDKIRGKGKKKLSFLGWVRRAAAGPLCAVDHTYLRPFWFLYAFSQPMTGHLKGLSSSGGITRLPVLPANALWRMAIWCGSENCSPN